MSNGSVLVTTGGASPIKVNVGSSAPIQVDTGATDTVDISIDSTGPAGPPGPMAPVVISHTEPTAADYGTSVIPLHAIWIQI